MSWLFIIYFNYDYLTVDMLTVSSLGIAKITVFAGIYFYALNPK